MKYLKLFENFKESFDDDALLELFYFIDNLSEVFDSQSTEGSNTYINYNYDDKLDYITIEYGWSTYEEGANEDLKVFWKESPIRVEFSEDASTVYGDYSNEHTYKFNSISELINFLRDRYSYGDLNEGKESGVTKSLKKKSEASGIPVSILRKVFSKGMQAWNAGHRPGVAQHQWGMGRVNSFITGSGGARKADADLWKKAKAAKSKKKKNK